MNFDIKNNENQNVKRFLSIFVSSINYIRLIFDYYIKNV